MYSWDVHSSLGWKGNIARTASGLGTATRLPTEVIAL
jgi:hypothetical protein